VMRPNAPCITRLKRQEHARKNHSYFSGVHEGSGAIETGEAEDSVGTTSCGLSIRAQQDASVRASTPASSRRFLSSARLLTRRFNCFVHSDSRSQRVVKKRNQIGRPSLVQRICDALRAGEQLCLGLLRVRSVRARTAVPVSFVSELPFARERKERDGEYVVIPAPIQGCLDRGAVREINRPLVTPIVLSDCDQTFSLSEILDGVR